MDAAPRNLTAGGIYGGINRIHSWTGRTVMTSSVDIRQEWVRFFVGIASAIVGIGIVILVLIAVYGESNTHSDLAERLIRIEQENQIQTCILLITPEERTPSRVGVCLPVPEE